MPIVSSYVSVTSVTVPKSYIVQTCTLTHTAHSTHLLYISHLPHCNISQNFFHAIFSTIKAYTICIDPFFLITYSLLLSVYVHIAGLNKVYTIIKHKLQIEVHQLCCNFFQASCSINLHMEPVLVISNLFQAFFLSLTKQDWEHPTLTIYLDRMKKLPPLLTTIPKRRWQTRLGTRCAQVAYFESSSLERRALDEHAFL